MRLKQEFTYLHRHLFMIIAGINWFPNPSKSSVRHYVKLIAVNARRELKYAETTTDVDIVYNLQKIYKKLNK